MLSVIDRFCPNLKPPEGVADTKEASFTNEIVEYNEIWLAELPHFLQLSGMGFSVFVQWINKTGLEQISDAVKNAFFHGYLWLYMC